jgi:secreted trypsin-like serine protease
VQDISVEETIPHPDYNTGDYKVKNNIALIRLKRESVYNFYVGPVCLPLTDQLRQANLNGIALTVAGWGRTEDSANSNIKLKVDVTVLPLEECKRVYLTRDLSTKQICAGGEDGKDSCNGDSGGPLMKVVDGKGYFYIAGVISFGPSPCGKQGKPGVYTKVSEYVDWIVETMKP